MVTLAALPGMWHPPRAPGKVGRWGKDRKTADIMEDRFSQRVLATPCVQVCDLIAGTIRRSQEGEHRLDDLAQAFCQLRYVNHARTDIDGYPIDSILKLF